MEYKKRDTVLAICYDFDKTLSPTDMQAQGYIQSIGVDVNDFWDKTAAYEVLETKHVRDVYEMK